MRSKRAPGGDSLLLWREKGGLSALLVLSGPGSLLLCPEEPLITGGKGGGGGGCQNAATIAPLTITLTPWFPLSLGEGLYLLLWARKQRLSKEVGRKTHICLVL